MPFAGRESDWIPAGNTSLSKVRIRDMDDTHLISASSLQHLVPEHFCIPNLQLCLAKLRISSSMSVNNPNDLETSCRSRRVMTLKGEETR